MFEIKQKPRLEWIDIGAGALIYLGLLLFLISLHVLAINTTGDTETVLVTTFRVFLNIYITVVIFGLIGVIIQFLRWLTWVTSTPEWQQKEMKDREE